MTDTKRVDDNFFTRVEGTTNGWFESNQKGEPIFNRGEVEAARRLAEAFPDWETRVTIGPWRNYDIAYNIKHEEKAIIIDLYSPRPGIQYIPAIIGEIKAKIQAWNRLLSFMGELYNDVERWLSHSLQPEIGHKEMIVEVTTARDNLRKLMRQMGWKGQF